MIIINTREAHGALLEYIYIYNIHGNRCGRKRVSIPGNYPADCPCQLGAKASVKVCRNCNLRTSQKFT